MRRLMAQMVSAVMSKKPGSVSKLLIMEPELIRARFEADALVSTIPHWLYAGDTALHLAAAALNAPVVQLLLRAKADPSAENRRGATPLHYACDARPKSGGVWDPSSQAKIIKLLVQHKADPNLADRGGASALHRAVRARSPAAVRELLKAGAKVDTRLGTRGSTPLQLAVRATGAGGTAGTALEQLEIIGLLVRHGADPATLDAEGKSAYDRAKARLALPHANERRAGKPQSKRPQKY